MQISKQSRSTVEKSKFGKISPLLLRVILGLMLFIKGINFIRNEGVLSKVFSEVELIQKLSLLQLIIPWIHILGGFFILIGVYTRLMTLIQIPLVIGAIFVLLSAKQNSFFNAEIYFALTILILLVLNIIFGDGFYSWKNLIRKEKEVL
ncbi:MAG: DoxX family protein [Bacteroidota bacterium]|jgi:putative oxidoreductase